MEFWVLLAGVAGLVVGWNLPQPAWAAAVQAWVVGWVKGLFN